MQKFQNAIITVIKKYTPFVWGHIDDIIVAHASEHTLWVISQALQLMFTQVGWILNSKKSVLTPSSRVKFLGAYWGAEGVKRSRRVTKTIFYLYQATMDMKLGGKILQRVRGFLNYYLSFAGLYFSFVNRFLLLKTRRPFFKTILYLIKNQFY